MSGEEDIVSRFGGDEFCLLIKDVTEKELRIRLELLVREMRAVYREEDASAQVSVSAGAVLCQDEGRELSSLMNLADKALYQTKEKGRDGYSIEIC
ncbi:GGDEF domain-containing protein [Ruminococcus sp. AM58-7XD]|nr:GGDEF domain-containing protein [Ruminococcus sp. AM58-7XD]